LALTIRFCKVNAVPNSFRFIGGLVLTAALLTLAAACDGPPPKPPVFNNRIAFSTAKWNTAVLAFKSKIEPLARGQDVSPAVAQQGYDDLAKEFKEMKRASRHMPVPVGSTSGQAYMNKYWAFLDVEDDLMQNEVKRIVTTVADSKLKPADKWAVINNKIFVDIERKEKPVRDDLQKAQSEFASAHKLTITTNLGK
jgi:hypothetical protein